MIIHPLMSRDLNQLYREAQYDEVIELSLNRLKTDSTHRKALYMLMMAYAQQKKYYPALLSFHRLWPLVTSYQQKKELRIQQQWILQELAETISPRTRQVINGETMPRNFSWVWPGALLGSSMFTKPEPLIILEKLGVTKVINLMEEAVQRVLTDFYRLTPKIRLEIHRVPNTEPPTLDQMVQIMESCEREWRQGHQVVVHCGGGKGRAGTVIACLMLKHGVEGPGNYRWESAPLSPQTVIDHLRKIRPGSIENSHQEKFVKEFHNHLRQEYQEALDHPENFDYPSTPYHWLSPNLNEKTPDETMLLTSSEIKDLCRQEVVITEKLDGGNCALYQGEVYARTHSHPATHESFDTIKELYRGRIQPMMETHSLPDSLMLFGENMTAVHSLSYSQLESWFYLFGILDTATQTWLSWPETVEIAQLLDLPTVPVLFSGIMAPVEMMAFLPGQLKSRSQLSNETVPVEREGMVVRTMNSFFHEDFGRQLCKYARVGHQENSKWESSRKWIKNQMVHAPVPEEPPVPTSQTTSRTTSRRSNLSHLTILVGAPGSGKSTFAAQIKKQHPEVTIINQDTLGNRKKCEKLMGEAIKKGKVILDRCNPTAEERKGWLKLAFNPPATAVYFDFPKDQLLHRARNRLDHPTIKPGSGRMAVNMMSKKMEAPTLEEGFKRVHTVHNNAEMNQLLQEKFASPPVISTEFFKFPRTQHLFDARELDPKAPCTVQRDDLLLAPKERARFFQRPVTLEEKIDGANLGISVDSEQRFQFQNRSKFVNSTIDQFKKLDEWTAQHRESLWDLLSSGQYILFGEWCYALHSTQYHQLPDYFLAFDLYDRWHQKFLSRRRFHEKLIPTTLSRVPVLGHLVIKNEAEVFRYFDQVSEFDEKQKIEGVYLRLDDPEDEYLEARCKAVSPAFTAQLTKKWTEGGIKPNRLASA